MRMVDYPAALRPDRVTVIAYGALLSEPSSRLTFPSLTNFRLVRVRNVRRLIAALCVEPAEGCSFVAAAFDVVLDDAQREAFCARETGYAIVEAPFHGLDAGEESRYHHFSLSIALGQHKSLPHVWGWARDSGLLPADVYLRHCERAVDERARPAHTGTRPSDGAVRPDRRTTLSEYLAGGARERVMAVRPPESMAERFGG
ncbi:hypothetical protein EMIHUDRAFT_206741 [Emiliania huxleyi CCMP1516]|uniref:Gamma-glutamylcyclotransferase n=2 Tax=Emiliania huxleyi TaxID=2903 RepID=A0A0D3JMD5_EMIH1|nr:hypothetical protein EMIHUDRAFT_206741 [Emiliania huxleyi CCMP1516]EOD24670.1 hypothetical protein EMIHUDRAFT_206741 [Emiliania huxleyi CCMP1516]|eukprot:XP_005777099.1 hypothetical protein EMIHUDRAFT_206741 [Emiliania huxleyi CCMP1516]